jgi:DNA-directed RNA polymerase subunit RPC12/RpoP
MKRHFGLCTKCNKKGLYKIESDRKGYTVLKCRYCHAKVTYSS